MKNIVKFEDLDFTKEYKFYGVDFNRFKLDKVVYEALEDESDGYRSYLDSVPVVPDSTDIFFERSLARVKIHDIDDGYSDYYSLVDIKDGHVWLKFGTCNYDDYYPYFIFEYYPKIPN